MARNKYPERTVEKILNVSFHLFAEKGYEKTTIQDIVNALGMSKGAIYHHFKSKEEIMEALSNRSFVERKSFDYDDTKLNGLEKIRKFMIREFSHQDKQNLDKMSASILRSPQFMPVILQNIMDYNAPMMTIMIEEAIKDGSAQCQDAQMASEAFMILANLWANPFIGNADETYFLRQIKTIGKLMEALGLPILDDELIQAIHLYYRNATA